MDEKNIKNYELAFLVDGEDDAHEAVKILNARGAVIVFEGPLKKADLFYPIMKRNSAHFGFFHFQCEAGRVLEIEEDLRLNNKILRHLIVAPPILPRTASFFRRGPRATSAAKPAEGERSERTDRSEEFPRRQEVVSNEELEEKLEEILK